MNVIRYGTPRAFLAAAEPFLLREEAAHNLLLGIPARLIARGAAAPSGVYLATAMEQGEIVGAAMMTPPYRLVLSQVVDPGALHAIAEDVVTIRPRPSGVQARAPVAEEFVAHWRRLTGEPSHLAVRERIHRLDAVRPVPAVPGALRSAQHAERAVLVDWLGAFAAEAFGPHNHPPVDPGAFLDARLGTPGEGFVIWDDGGPRCLAGFGGVTRNGVRVGPVYTPPEHRGCGYATACVAEVTRRLLADGRRFCMLYTDLANPTSNRIYRRIGYDPVCDVVEYRFVRPPDAVSGL